MPSFGENLRREREKRKITLDQISQSTKISTRMLHALEDEKFNQLPGGIFNKGFVRAYARAVGLDEDQAVADYLEASGESAPVMPEIPPEHPAPRIVEEETPRRPLPWGLFAALLLLAALALSLWSHRQKKESVAIQPTPQSEATQSSPPPATTQPPASEPSIRPVPSSSTKAPSSQPAPQPTKPAISENPPTATAKQSTTSPAAAAVFVVNVQAREDSWTVITSDGRTVYSGLLVAGDQRSIRGQKEVIVKAGNAGAVDLSFNGKKIPPLGQYGEIRTITFGPEGVIPNPPPPVAH